jgi:hypothetical protein
VSEPVPPRAGPLQARRPDEVAVAVAHPEDAAEASQVRRAAHRVSNARWGGVVAGAVFLALGALGASLKPGDGGTYILLGAGVASLAFGLLPRSAWPIRRGDARFRGDQVRTLDREGLHVRGDGLAFDLPWKSMTRLAETPEFFLFFDARRRAHHLTKARLQPDELEAVKRMIRKRESILESDAE